MIDFNAAQQPLSMTLDRTQTVTSQMLNGVDWGVTNNKPPVNPYSFKNKNYTLPDISRPSSSIPDSARLDYKAPTSVTPDNVATAKQWVNNNHAVVSSGTTGIDQANHNMMADKSTQVIDAVQNGTMTPEEAKAGVKNDPDFQASPVWDGVITGGLAIASGKTPLEAYQLSQEASKKAGVANSMSSNISELQKHYTTDSIQAAISAQDRSLLVPRTLTLEEQEQKAADAAAAARQEKLTDRDTEWKHQQEVTNANHQFELDKDQAKKGEWKVNAKGVAYRINPDTGEPEFNTTGVAKATPANAAGALGILTTKGGNAQEIKAVTDRIKKPIEKIQAASTSLASFEDWDNKSDDQKLAAVKAGGDGLVRSILGGNATLTTDAISEIAGRDQKAAHILDKLNKKALGTVTDGEMKYITTLAQTALDDNKGQIRQIMSQKRDAYMRKNPDMSNVDVQQNLETIYGVNPSDYMTNDELSFSNANDGAWNRGYKIKRNKTTPTQQPQTQNKAQQSSQSQTVQRVPKQSTSSYGGKYGY